MLEQSFQQHLNSSTSILHHQIQPSDHGKKLECRASNSATEIPLSTGRRLYVYCKLYTLSSPQMQFFLAFNEK